MKMRCKRPPQSPYMFVALLIATIVSITSASFVGRAGQPSDKPTAFRAKKAWAHGALIAESTQPRIIVRPDDEAAVEGVDPARQTEKNAEKHAVQAVPDKLPPGEDIRNEEAEEVGKSAAELTGLKSNAHGDTHTMYLTLILNVTMVSIFVLVFSGLRLKYPLIYSGNGCVGAAENVQSFFGWIRASLDTTGKMAANTAGLDGAMLLEFFTMCCKILAVIGIPMVCIMCPLHFFYGGGGLSAKSISSIAMGNVIVHHPWLYYLHAIITNLVVVTVIHIEYATMTNFLKLRYSWLKSLSAPRCLTVLVEGIPPAWRSDAKLKEFFSGMFHEAKVKDCVMVKKAPNLKKLYDEQVDVKAKLDEAEDVWMKSGRKDEERPMVNEWGCIATKIDAIKFYQEKFDELTLQVNAEREAAQKEAETVGGVNSSTGFVTFAGRRQATICRTQDYSAHLHEWVVSAPPPVSDVLWQDLYQHEQSKTLFSLVAHACCVGVYVCFIPLVVLGTNLTHLVDAGYFQPFWDSFAPGLSLMLCLAFLPTILLLIFRSFLTLKADIYAQSKLQIWYFYFMLFFVILVTCISKTIVETFKEIVRRPETIMELLAEHLPDTTHFYMDFLMLQWGEQAMNFMRHAILAKFLLFKHGLGHEESVAKDLAEPEDQDYYGIGARSARMSINMLIAIIFGTLSPLVSILGLMLFGLCRLFHGYNIVFAESKKPDLGGVFFFTKLRHVLLGTGIYSALMTAVLFYRARTKAPCLIALPSLIYTIYCYLDFGKAFAWTELPFTEVCFHEEDGEEMHHDSGHRYIQPEFVSEDKQGELRGRSATKSNFEIDGNLDSPRFHGSEGFSIKRSEQSSRD